MTTDRLTRSGADHAPREGMQAGSSYRLGRFLEVYVVRVPGPGNPGEFTLSNGRGERLGRIHWGSGWKRYLFSPDYDVSFPSSYLRILDRFMHKLDLKQAGLRPVQGKTNHRATEDTENDN